MSTEQSQWNDVKNNYLQLIQLSLASLDHPRRSEILSNVAEHLERKYAELSPGERTWESFQRIITEMGPPADYAVLLCDDIISGKRSRLNIPMLLAAIFVIVLFIVGAYLILNTPEKTSTPEVIKTVPIPPVKPAEPNAFIVSFKSKDPNAFRTYRELLHAFNEKHPDGVRTHHYRTQVIGDQLIGYICTDNKTDANAISDMLKRSNALDFLNTAAVTSAEFETHCRLKQVSLPSNLSAQCADTGAITPDQEGMEPNQIPIAPPNNLQTSYMVEPTVFGKWIAVDYVPKTEDFVPGQQQYKKKMMLRALQFIEPATVYWSFNNNVVKQTSFGDAAIETVNGYSARYTLKTIDGQDYLFVDWMTVEVVDGKQPACRYVLKRENVELTMEANGQSSEDDSDEVDNANVLGQWVSVDFVREMDQFDPGRKFWRDSLYLTGLEFQNNGRVWCSLSNNSRFQHSWVPGKVESGESRPAFYTVKNIDGNPYMFFEWISGDVTIRGQKPCYYVLKQTTSPQRAVGKVTNRKIVIGANYCTMDFIQSKFGQATRREEKMLRYPDKGVDFCFSNRGILSEVHLNQGYQGQLKTGISLTSTAEDVFRAYGSPLKILKAADLHGIRDERVLYQKGDTSRIYYGKHGLIFWFQDDVVLQIVIFKGEVELVF